MHSLLQVNAKGNHMRNSTHKREKENQQAKDMTGNGPQKQRWNLFFSPELERSYEADRNLARNRDLVRFGFFAMVVYDLFLINDWYIRPEIFFTAVTWRGIATLYSYIILGFIWRGIPSRLREVLISSAVVMVTFCSNMIFYSTSTGIAVYDPFIFSLIFFAANALLPLRFVDAIWSSFLNISITLIFVYTHDNIPDTAIPFMIGLLIGIVTFSLLTCYRLERTLRQSYLLRLKEQHRSESAMRTADEFALQSRTDPLTKLANRRALDEALAQYCRKAAENRQAISILMIDIDHFKAYNDSMGHLAGDECLKKVAETMRTQLRDTDFIARYGGEEFVVLLPRSDRETTMIIAERLRESVISQGIEYRKENSRRTVTISIGAVVARPKLMRNQERLVKLADEALYEAKNRGRNCSVMAN
jgi:diguanylate cyclase (GGDEF)-like protein